MSSCLYMHILRARNFSCICIITEVRWPINERHIPLASFRVTFAAQNMGSTLLLPINVNGNHVANSPYSVLKSVPFRTRRGYI